MSDAITTPRARLALPVVLDDKPRNPAVLRLVRFSRNPTAMMGLVLVLLAFVAAFFAPLLTPYDPALGDLAKYVQPPSLEHPFGTDDVGRDILTRILYGARISLQVAIFAEIGGLLIGLLLGLMAGYFGGWPDILLMRLVDIFMSFPLLIIAIALVGVLGSSQLNVIFALALVTWPFVTRLVRSQVLSIRETEYVLAARSTGAGHFRIMFRHVFPNLLTPLVIFGTLGIANVILAEASLSFLGLGGADIATPSWGKMLTESRAFIRSAWWMPFFPGLAILLTVLGFNLLGDGLRDVLDVKNE